MINDKNFSADNTISELSSIFSKLDDPQLVKDFLSAILTKKEIEEIAKRWEIIKRIDSGISQRNISKDLGISLCKITRGSKELKKDNSPLKKILEIK